MRVEFSQAFQKLTGESEVDIHLDQPVAMGAVLRLLAAKYPAFSKYLEFSDDALLGAHLTVFRSGRFLSLDDPVAHDDTLKILLPVTGG